MSICYIQHTTRPCLSSMQNITGIRPFIHLFLHSFMVHWTSTICYIPHVPIFLQCRIFTGIRPGILHLYYTLNRDQRKQLSVSSKSSPSIFKAGSTINYIEGGLHLSLPIDKNVWCLSYSLDVHRHRRVSEGWDMGENKTVGTWHEMPRDGISWWSGGWESAW